MSIATEITRLQTAKADLKTAIEAKGVTVPSSAKLDDYPDYVDQIQTGGGGETKKYTVIWFDYDGTILKQEEVNEGGSSTAPTVPTHQYLTFEEWVHGNTLTNIDQDYFNIARYSCTGNAAIRKVNVPAGETLTLYADKYANTNEVITVNWGDGTTSTMETLSGWTAKASHTYSAAYAGYVTMSTTGSYVCLTYGGSISEIFVEEYYIPTIEATTRNKVYWNLGYKNPYFKAVVLPGDATSLPDQLFGNAAPLVLAIPYGITEIKGIWNGDISASNQLIAVNIPSSVTAIGQSFTNHSNLKYITKELYATSIGHRAFRLVGCTGSIKFMSSITTMNPGVFRGSKFREIDISNGTYTELGNYDGGFFEDCEAEIIKVSTSVTTIGGSAFRNCANLTKVDGLSGVTNVGALSFRDTPRYTEPISFTGVTSLGGGVFRKCGTPKITITGTYTEIPNYDGNVICYCDNLTELTIGSSVTTIGGSFCEKCPKLESVTIPASVTTISGYLFRDSCIKNVTLTGVSVGDGALYYDYFAESLHIGTGTTFGSSNFLAGTYRLKEISCDSGWTPSVNLSFSASEALSHDSMVGFFTNLGTAGSSITLTFGSVNLSRLTSAEKAIATNKGYTLA